MYTLEQIIKTWHECYGEDMTEEYAGFLDSLQAQGYSDDKDEHVEFYILGELYEKQTQKD
jgi:hypothetical protein